MTLEGFRRLNSAAARAAALALERLTGKPVSVKLTAAERVGAPDDIPGLSPDQPSACVYFPVSGNVRGSALLCLSKVTAASMSRRFAAELPASGDRTALEESALKELGNVICCRYLTVLANALHERIVPGLPRLLSGNCGPLFHEMVASLTADGPDAWVVEVEVGLGDRTLVGQLLVALRSERLVEAP